MRTIFLVSITISIIFMTVVSCTTSTITVTPPTTTKTVTTTSPTPPPTTITSTPTTTKTTTTTFTPTHTPATTAGELASFDGTLYNKNCTLAADCHAKFGEGAEEELSAANLSQYGNAETLFSIVSSIMHLAIGDYEEDAPTPEEYVQIIAYMLVENGTV
ncbi:MAG: hypothetical protein JSV74_00495 [Dehalococcoidia bacterium]|nr:MAG: hypothetical protein JSV74_00495 [Dehalococcoidia bacterium]